MSYRPLVIIAIVLSTAAILRFVYWIAPAKQSSRVIIRGTTVLVDVARTVMERDRGLSGRMILPEDHGMLFLLPNKETPSFWMKNMLMPLDIIWIADGRIADMTLRASPPSFGVADDALPRYAPRVPVTMVLEVRAGVAERYGWGVGDHVTVEL